MRNLVNETEFLVSGREVSWVGSSDGEYAMSWDEFKEKFKDLEYNSGFGSQKIATDLVVVFTDGGWLEREEYDGAEHWVDKSAPVREENAKSFDVVGGDEYMWEDLERMNRRKDVRD